MNRVCNRAIMFAQGMKQEAEIRGLHPTAWAIGYKLYDQMREAFFMLIQRAELKGKETLYGLPVHLTFSTEYGLSLEIEELSFDFGWYHDGLYGTETNEMYLDISGDGSVVEEIKK